MHKQQRAKAGMKLPAKKGGALPRMNARGLVQGHNNSKCHFYALEPQRVSLLIQLD